MSKKILLVEDEALIAMNEAQMLKKHGYEVITVYNGEKAIEVVDSDPDISLILMDIDLGKGIDGTEAAEKILEKQDIPVVFLSSHTEQDVVEKTEGITSYGYIVKNSGVTVLLASIRMAFRLYEAHIELKNQKENLRTALIKQEQTAEELMDSEEKFRTMMNQSIDMIFLHDLEGFIVDVNQTGIEQTGYSREELLSMAISDLDPDYRAREDGGNFWNNVEYNQPYRFEARLISKDNFILPIEIFVSKVLMSGSTYIMTCSRNISDRKKKEKRIRESERKLRLTLNSIGDAVISTDMNGNINRMNPVAEDITGWSVDSAHGKKLNEIFHIINADSREIIDNPIEKVIQTGEIVGLANHTVLISKDGREYQIADSAAPIKDDEGNITGVVLVFRDVTENYEKEQSLKRQGYRLRLTQDIAHVGNWDLDITKNTLLWSDEIYRIFGLEPQEFEATYEAFMKRVHPEDRKKVDSAYWGSIKEGKDTYEVEHRIVRADNSEIRYVHEKCEHLRDDFGDIIRSIGMVQDITERKKNEEELKESKNRYKRLVHNSPNLIMETDIDTHEIISCNPAMANNLGSSITEIVGKKIDDFVPTHILKKRLEVTYFALETGQAQTLEDERNGKYFYTTYIPIVDDARRSIQTITIDVSEQKRTENLIREYADKLELTMEAANIAWWEIDIETGKVSFSKKKTNMLGYSQEQFHQYKDFTKIVHTDDYEQMMSSMRALLNGAENKYDIEYRIKAKKGEYRRFHDIGIITRYDENKKPKIVSGIVIDVSDLRRKEEELQESRKRFNLAIEGTGAGLWDWDMKSDRVVYSKRWKNMLGYQDHEIEDSFYGWKKLWHPDDTAHIEKAINDYLAGKTENYEIIHRLLHKDGTWRWILTRGGILKDSEGNPYRWVGTNLDITNSKKNEEKLHNAMKELNHRVKNNLNMVSSLISLKESETEEDLSDLKHRIDTIKLVHEKLYQKSDIEQIEVKEYFRELLESIFASTTKEGVELVNNVVDVSIPTKTAISLGLVVNEIATNAIKYGFTSDKENRFTVELTKDSEDTQYTLTLSNTGSPFPDDVGMEYPQTMGLQLISNLVEQLDGTIELQRKPNPIFTIMFPVGGQ